MNGSQYYYVFLSDSELDSYIFMITNSNYVSYVVKNVSLQTIIIFLLVIMLTIFLVFIWSNRFVYRIKSIQNHITNLPKSKYEKVYEDNTSDEIGELSKSIELMRIDIKENEKTKQEMLQNISHDFKTPIAVIKTYAEAELDGVVSNDEAYRTIIEQAEILKKKVNRLLQYNSLEYLTKDKEFENIDIKALVLDVVSAYKYQTNIKFELDLADDVYFKGYRENLYTVIANILDNGLRYAKSLIKIVLRKDRLRIYNDGDPIDSQFLNSVFKPYEKGSNGNFGLGMSIVKKTLDFFGLNLEVKNEDFGGVSFIITKD
jgi:two-component system sensor histidine kinase CssS